jgi:hypothetical protein
MEHSSDILVLVAMSERATTKLIGLSVSGIFGDADAQCRHSLAEHKIGAMQSPRLEPNAGSLDCCVVHSRGGNTMLKNWPWPLPPLHC